MIPPLGTYHCSGRTDTVRLADSSLEDAVAVRDKGRRVRLMLAMSYKQEGIYKAATVRANTYYFSSSRASMGGNK